MIYDANNLPRRLILGRDGENKIRAVEFDCSDWATVHPEATVSIMFERPDGQTYPALVTDIGAVVTWVPTETEYVEGTGKLQLVMKDGEVIGKSEACETYCAGGINTNGPIPDTAPDWAVELLKAYEQGGSGTTARVEGTTLIIDGGAYVDGTTLVL